MSQPIHTSGNQLGSLAISPDLLLCTACGTQYSTSNPSELPRCKICDDPRQFVPPSGQSFTTLRQASSIYSLAFEPDPDDDSIISVRIDPPTLGIGQRAIIIKTPHGNILWDLVCFLDEPAVTSFNEHGGIAAIVISHPHFWTTWRDWSDTFKCPVYVGAADAKWLSREPTDRLVLLEHTTTIVPGVEAVVCGGHFDGSMALYTTCTTTPTLFHADTIHTVPNGRSPDIGQKMEDGSGHSAYTFMWSIPNMVPLTPKQILGIWRALKGRKIDATYGFVTVRYTGGMRIEQRILESMKLFVRRCGFSDGMDVEGLEILGESL